MLNNLHQQIQEWCTIYLSWKKIKHCNFLMNFTQFYKGFPWFNRWFWPIRFDLTVPNGDWFWSTKSDISIVANRHIKSYGKTRVTQSTNGNVLYNWVLVYKLSLLNFFLTIHCHGIGNTFLDKISLNYP